jgi:hypothetical protein
VSSIVLWNLGADLLENRMDDKAKSDQAQAQSQVQIKSDEKELLGMYSNLVLIHHHAEEFTLNFVYVYPDGTQGKLLSSMIVSPSHALGENISRFELQFGPIQETTQNVPIGAIGPVQ